MAPVSHKLLASLPTTQALSLQWRRGPSITGLHLSSLHSIHPEPVLPCHWDASQAIHIVGSVACIQVSPLLGHSTAIQYRTTVPIFCFTDSVWVLGSSCLYKNWSFLTYIFTFIPKFPQYLRWFKIPIVTQHVFIDFCHVCHLYHSLDLQPPDSGSLYFLLAVTRVVKEKTFFMKWLEQLTNAPLLSCELLPSCRHSGVRTIGAENWGPTEDEVSDECLEPHSLELQRLPSTSIFYLPDVVVVWMLPPSVCYPRPNPGKFSPPGNLIEA